MLIRIFQRKTQSTSFIPEIDGLRFFAIITVMVYHMNTAFSRSLGLEDFAMETMGGQWNTFSPAWWIIRLDLGVKVFFSISGMVLALPFLKTMLAGGRPIDLKDYYYRRLTRLEPPFIISLLFFFLVHLFVLNADLGKLLPSLLTGVLYAHKLVYGTPNPINPVTWSLETEAQFYLMVPLLFAVMTRYDGRWMRISLISALIIFSLWFKHYFYTANIKEVQATIFYYLTNFMTGVLFAWMYLRRDNWFRTKSLSGDLVGLLSLFLLFFFYKPQFKPLYNLAFNAATFGLMFGVFKGSAFNWFFTRPIIYIIGGMCYSIYLLHYAMLHLLTRLTSGISLHQGYIYDLFLQLMILLPVVLVVCGAFFLLVEKPCMDKHWPQKLMAWWRSRKLKRAS
jgi:peptidoglycan/LPS O-acetylase OafA/YrhL